MRSDIRFIYFDLDDTLLDHKRAERQALADLCEAHAHVFGAAGVERVQQTYDRLNSALWVRYSNSEISQADLKRLRFEQILEELATDGATPEELNDYYLSRYFLHWHYIPGAIEAFRAIAAHYPVGALTNGFAHIQRAKMERFPELASAMKVVVISDEVGHMKPHRPIFDHAAKVAGRLPGQILYVGDSFRSDVQGALNAGWHAAWYTNDRTQDIAEERVFRFSHWDELIGWLGVRDSETSQAEAV